MHVRTLKIAFYVIHAPGRHYEETVERSDLTRANITSLEAEHTAMDRHLWRQAAAQWPGLLKWVLKT